MDASSSRPPLWSEIRVLLIAAMLIFVYTIGIGILNGSDIVDFDRRRILGHVHGGTLGWLTLGVFAASLWLFGQSGSISARERTVVRWLCGLAIVGFAAYVVAFSTTYNEWRPVLGIIATVVIVGMLAWVATRIRVTELGVPHWGFLAALGTSVVGAVLGVLLAWEIATGNNVLPDGGEDAHPATMVVGFLIPVSLALAEWAFRFPVPPRADRLGITQMALPFAGGILLMLSLLFDITPLAPLAVLLQVIGVIIFIKRLWPDFRRVDWKTPNPQRYGIAAAIAIIFVIGLAQFLIIRHQGDLEAAPMHRILALDHAQFIGAMTNAFFAMLLASTIAGGRGNRIDQVVFLVVNVGIIGFVAGLLFDVTVLKRIFAPLMGVGVLLGLGLYGGRLAGLITDSAYIPQDAETGPTTAGGR